MAPTQRPFFANFFSAFRARTNPTFQAKSSSTSSTISPGSLAATAHVSTTTTTVMSNPRSITTKAGNTSTQSSDVPIITSPTRTTATSFSAAAAAVAASSHRYTSPYSRSPGTSSPGGPHSMALSPAGTSTPLTRGRQRRGSDSSNSSGGFMDALGPENKWYIGGRTVTGEEKFYRLGLVTARPYLFLFPGVLICSYYVFVIWSPFSSASVPQYLSSYVPGIDSSNIKDILNDTLGFEKIMIVNLLSRPDKLDSNVLAASITGFNFEAISALRGEDVHWKSLPHGFNAAHHIASNGTIGAYRSLLNAVRSVVARRLSTALIMEDDVDWDVNLKKQLQTFALGSRYVTSLASNGAESTQRRRTHSPYGDGWEILNIGHCASGQHGNSPIPSFDDDDDDDGRARLFRVSNDRTAPPPDRVTATFAGSPESVELLADPGTRLVFRGWSGCSWAHAVTYKAAQKMLNAMSVQPFDTGYDNGLMSMCLNKVLDCVQVQPPLLGAHTPIGDANKQSDMNNDKHGITEKAWTHNVAYSVKSNFGPLLAGEEARSQWEDLMPQLEEEDDVRVEYTFLEPGVRR